MFCYQISIFQDKRICSKIDIKNEQKKSY